MSMHTCVYYKLRSLQERVPSCVHRLCFCVVGQQIFTSKPRGRRTAYTHTPWCGFDVVCARLPEKALAAQGRICVLVV